MNENEELTERQKYDQAKENWKRAFAKTPFHEHSLETQKAIRFQMMQIIHPDTDLNLWNDFFRDDLKLEAGRTEIPIPKLSDDLSNQVAREIKNQFYDKHISQILEGGWRLSESTIDKKGNVRWRTRDEFDTLTSSTPWEFEQAQEQGLDRLRRSTETDAMKVIFPKHETTDGSLRMYRWAKEHSPKRRPKPPK